MNPAVATILIFLLAFVVEGGIEYFIGIPLSKSEKLAPYAWLLQYVAAGVGVGLAFYYQLDLVSQVAGQVGGELPPSAVGYVITGLGIGRGSNYVHQLVSEYLPKSS